MSNAILSSLVVEAVVNEQTNGEVTLSLLTEVQARLDQTSVTVTLTGATSVNLITQRAEIEGQFKVAYLTDYTELTKVGDKLTQVDVWDTAAKATKLFTKILQYSDDQITSTSLTDEVRGAVLTKTFTYSGDDLIDITKVIS